MRQLDPSSIPVPPLVELFPMGLAVTGLATIVGVVALGVAVRRAVRGEFPAVYYAIAALPLIASTAFGFHSLVSRILVMGQLALARIEITAAFFWLPANGALITFGLFIAGLAVQAFAVFKRKKNLKQSSNAVEPAADTATGG